MEQLTFLPQKKSNDWKWRLSDYPEKNGLKVFSCFSCAGGSTMGYKLSGYEVVGNVEIDPRMNEIYVNNHHPKYNYCMDIREFNQLKDLPEELYNIDILDGSPPCSTFSMAGEREKGWGVEKRFKEGQKLQTLDDLAFVFIETAKKLNPKVVVIENVAGLLAGEAWSYVQRIYKDLMDIGYQVNHWLLNGAKMGVPQSRERVFFVAIRNDIGVNPRDIAMCFDYEPVTYRKIFSPPHQEVKPDTITAELLDDVRPEETDLSQAYFRKTGKNGWFQTEILDLDRIVPTIRAKMPDNFIRGTKMRMSPMEVILSQTFPEDFDFGSDSYSNIAYVCGMSVPPVMMKRVSGVIAKQVFGIED